MILREILVPTQVAHPGMKVVEAFRECIDNNVQGIPFQDANGVITGRISVRHIFRIACIQEDVVKGAHLLGDRIMHLDMPSIERCRILDQPVEKFLLDNIPTLTSSSPEVKAVAIMEKYNSSYLFVLDDGEYQGVVTRLGIVRLLLKNQDRCEWF